MRYFLFLVTLVLATCLNAQEQKARKKTAPAKFKEVSEEIKDAVDKNDPSALARSFVKSGNYYKELKNYSKTEFYYKKAILEYKKVKNKDEIAIVSRELAKIQEQLNRKDEAIQNYQMSNSNIMDDESLMELNKSDIKRIETSSSKTKESINAERSAIQSKIDLSKSSNKENEIQESYIQMGNSYLKENKKEEAIQNFEKAYKTAVHSNETKNQAKEINQQITDIYVEEEEFDKAIETKKKLVNDTIVERTISEKIIEIQELGKIYDVKQDYKNALKQYKTAYDLALKNSLTLEAKSSLEMMLQLNSKSQQSQKNHSLYAAFLKELPRLIQNDSSLMRSDLIKETEYKIEQLLKEKDLKDQLIHRKNVFNYSLLGFITILVGFIGVILWTLRSIKRKNIKIELQSLRREMNPHFIFNSLNSINQFIARNDEKEANNYLTKFSKLMRGVMENSKDDFILLTKELEVIENYLELEKSRFTSKFDYKIELDDNLLDSDIEIPSMIIQPYLENAIWHGLRYIEDKGWLNLKISKKSNSIFVEIEDNGIGIKKSKELKTKHQSKHKGRGMSNTSERIKLLNLLHNFQIQSKVNEKKSPESGVKVEIIFPQT